MFLIYLFFIIGSLIHSSIADTPANCTYEDITGDWYFYEGPKKFTRTIQCSTQNDFHSHTKVTLLFSNVAVDENGHQGHWTLIYNQGFEVTINYRKYFAFSYYETQGDTVVSYCDQTFSGWSHDILSNNWACYKAKKVKAMSPKVDQRPINLLSTKEYYKADHELIAAINEKQKRWKAANYPQLESKTHHELFLMRGGPKSRIANPPKPAAASKEIKKASSLLPASFDWRNVSGVNYVSPVRDQGSCGSCYSFSSAGMLESRLRVYTNNKVKVILSPQDIVSCSQYSQGCDGGFPYLIAGKYGQDFGFLDEQCYPYRGKGLSCKRRNCTRIFVASYEYVGGFYGACNEDVMKLALVKNGPLSVAFEVQHDFMSYKGGIYHHTGLESKFNPFQLTNHAVLLVGYGEENNQKYWIVKNSWGKGWGEDGYFRIRRGVNECAIESIAVEAFPIPG